MPTESQAAEAQRLLAQHAVRLEDVDKKIEALVVNRDQQFQLVVEETGAEIKKLRALIKEHQVALAAIEEQKKARIAAINRQWKADTGALQTKRNRIQVSSDVQHSLLASIRKMPSELLVNIFEHFVREGGSPWTLALVSVAWSKVVFSTCSFWSTIHVKIDTKSARTANSSLTRLKAHLRRAGTRSLLDLHLCFFTIESRRPVTQQILKACELIGGRDMLARWRSVTLVQPPLTLTQEQLEPIFAHPLPNLHSLTVQLRCRGSLLDIVLKLIDTSAKAFRILSVDQRVKMDLRAYPNILKRVEVLRYTNNKEEYLGRPALFGSLSLMRALQVVKLPGSVVAHHQTQDWMRSVKKATFFGLDMGSTSLFDPQREYLLNLRRLSLVRCSPPSYQPSRIKTPNLRVLKVVGDLAVTSCFDIPILDDLSLISHIRTWTRHSGKREEEVLRAICWIPSKIPRSRHLQLQTIASPARTVEFLKEMPELERLTIQEHPIVGLSYDLFAALKEVVEDVVHADGSSQRKMAVCPALQNLTIKAPSASWPHLSEWVTEVVAVRQSLGEPFEGVVSGPVDETQN